MRFDAPNLPGEMEATVTLKPVLCDTELNVEQSGIPAMIPVEMGYPGWQPSLEQLAKLVAPVIQYGGPVSLRQQGSCAECGLSLQGMKERARTVKFVRPGGYSACTESDRVFHQVIG